MNALSELLNLGDGEKRSRGLIHTTAEIAQQPDSWQSTFSLFKNRLPEIAEFLTAAGMSAAPGARPIVFLIGAGSSDYVGQSLAYLFRKVWQCEVVAAASTDLLTHVDELVSPDGKYLWISFSRSGDSPEGVAVIESACQRRPDIHQLVISCNVNGRMIKANAGRPQGLSICLDDRVNDRGLAMTSSFTNMVVLGQCLAHWNEIDRYEPVLSQMVHTGKNLLPVAADRAAALAGEPYTKACFVGSGSLKAVAKESALKLLELTAGRVVTMSESALGLRHGPMSALDEETLLVCFLSSNPRVQQYERDLLEEIENKRLVSTPLVVAGSAVLAINSLAEHSLAPAVPIAVSDDYRPAVDVIFGQLLGLFFSIRSNLQPDCPSPNGAISRVVQNVSIHS